MRENKAALTLFLQRLLRRSVLTADERETILALPGVVVGYRVNQDVVAPDEMVDHACLIADGLLARFVQMASGERQIIGLHIAGDMADLHSVVAPRSALPLQALAPSNVVRVPHRALRDACNRYPAIAYAFWRDAIVDNTMVAQSLLRIGRRKALGRLAHLLCEMAIRYEQVGASRTRFPLRARQLHLADALGLTPVHINRTLRKLRERGLAEIGGGEVVVHDWDGLVGEAEFDPGYLQLEAIDLHP